MIREKTKVDRFNPLNFIGVCARVSVEKYSPYFDTRIPMFDVIVDSEIMQIREDASNGNFDSMCLLASYIQKGMHTRKDPDLALSIFNYLIARKEDIPFKETYWNALCQKAHIIALKAEENAEAIISEISLEMIRHMTQFPPEEWNFGRMSSAVEWLQNHPYPEQKSRS